VTLVGTKVREASAPVSFALPTALDTLFLGVLSDRGPTDRPMFVRSMADFVSKAGKRVTYSLAYDYLDYYFRQGGARAYLGRYVGPAALRPATVTITDSGAAVVFTATALGPGDWYNGLNIQIVVGTGTERSIVITHDTDLDVNENSGVWNSNAELLAWAQNSQYIKLAVGASSNQPNAQTKNLGATQAGTDDRASITDATALAALNLFNKDLGPGAVGFAQRTTATAQGQLLDHAAANGRFALPDPPDGLTKSGALSATAALRSHVNASWGALFHPWIDIDGLTPNTFRAIPPSAAVACPRAQRDERSLPGPGSGRNLWDPRAGQGVHADYPVDQDREDLNEGSVNLIVSKGGTIRIYGFRSLVNKLTNPNVVPGNIAAHLHGCPGARQRHRENYVERQVDGQGLIFAQLGSELLSMLKEFYDDGALFGTTFAEAASVDTTTVNTPSTIAAGEIHAKIMIVVSPTGEAVILDIVKQQIPGDLNGSRRNHSA
jgi:hypothetical protein